MDAFLTNRLTKNSNGPFAPGKITCVHGKPGTGKTHFVSTHLPRHVVLDHTILKSKQSTLDFMERLCWTDMPVVIDNWESIQVLVGTREVTKALSRGPTVIVSHTLVDIPDTIDWPMKVMSIDEILTATNTSDRSLAEKCHGDVRSYMIQLVNKSDTKDIFETPIEFVQQLLVHPRPIDYFDRTVHEHGYTWGVIQDNYVDAKKISIEECAYVAESLSLGDVYDTVIYSEGAWDTLMPYFIESACIRPCTILNGRINIQRLRPGSLWSKFQNVCMRLKKIASTRMDRDALTVIRKYIECEKMEILKDYPLDPSAIDILNHLGTPKLRPKLVDQAKKIVRGK